MGSGGEGEVRLSLETPFVFSQYTHTHTPIVQESNTLGRASQLWSKGQGVKMELRVIKRPGEPLRAITLF